MYLIHISISPLFIYLRTKQPALAQDGRLLQFAPPARRLVMLEGGYELHALGRSVAAHLKVLGEF